MTAETGNPTYWIIVGSVDNFRRTAERGFTIQGIKSRHRKKAERMMPGDKIIYYVTGIKAFGAISTITSPSFESHEVIWKSGDPKKEAEDYPFRVQTTPNLVLDEARFLQDEIGRRLHPEGIVLRLLLRVAALPNDLMALEGGRGDRRDSTERLDSSHVVDDLVARHHPLCLLAVTGLDPLDRESALCGAAEVVDRADNDPVGRVTGFSGHCCLSPRRWFRPHTGASSRPGGARSKYRTRRTAGPRR